MVPCITEINYYRLTPNKDKIFQFSIAIPSALCMSVSPFVPCIVCAIVNQYCIFIFVSNFIKFFISFHFVTKMPKKFTCVLFKKYITEFGSNVFLADQNVLFCNY
jgi:hypothetical protein